MGAGKNARDRRIVYQYSFKRAKRDNRNIDLMIDKAERIAEGKAPLKKARFLKVTGAQKALDQATIDRARHHRGIHQTHRSDPARSPISDHRTQRTTPHPGPRHSAGSPRPPRKTPPRWSLSMLARVRRPAFGNDTSVCCSHRSPSALDMSPFPTETSGLRGGHCDCPRGLEGQQPDPFGLVVPQLYLRQRAGGFPDNDSRLEFRQFGPQAAVDARAEHQAVGCCLFVPGR